MILFLLSALVAFSVGARSVATGFIDGQLIDCVAKLVWIRSRVCFAVLTKQWSNAVKQKQSYPSFGDEKSDEKRGTELEEDETTPEIKVRCSDFYRTLEEDSILLNHQKRDLILRAVSLGVDRASDVKATKFEDSISWGMYMHALIFHIHDSHEREKRLREEKARDAAMKAPKKFDYFDPQSTLTLIQSSENTSEQDKESVNMPNDSLVSASSSIYEESSVEIDEEHEAIKKILQFFWRNVRRTNSVVLEKIQKMGVKRTYRSQSQFHSKWAMPK